MRPGPLPVQPAAAAGHRCAVGRSTSCHVCASKSRNGPTARVVAGFHLFKKTIFLRNAVGLASRACAALRPRGRLLNYSARSPSGRHYIFIIPKKCISSPLPIELSEKGCTLQAMATKVAAKVAAKPEATPAARAAKKPRSEQEIVVAGAAVALAGSLLVLLLRRKKTRKAGPSLLKVSENSRARSSDTPTCCVRRRKLLRRYLSSRTRTA